MSSTSHNEKSAKRSCIDAHVHVWTPDVTRYPLAKGFSPSQMQPAGFTPNDLLRYTVPLGINRVVLIQMVFYGFDNSYMLEAIRTQPEIFSGVALVDENGQDPAGHMRRLKQLGVRGARITPPSLDGRSWLSKPGMEALWEVAAEEQMAICPLIDPSALPVLDEACKKYPDTTVVIDHCARIGGDGKIRESDLRNLCSLARHPNVYVKLSAFYFLENKQPPYDDLAPMIKRLLDAFGSNRLMWASDSPFQVLPPHTYQDSFKLIRDRLDFLSEGDRDWILGRTAEKVFFASKDRGTH